ncbi:MAG TPA: hypothetical protein VKS79_16125 [Gemmataceae bacterium]|nr:hypothetical protein [Gemmataceae bacterium]
MMLIYYRIGARDLAQKYSQRTKICYADDGLLRQAHQAAACPIKHPLRDLQLTSIAVA